MITRMDRLGRSMLQPITLGVDLRAGLGPKVLEQGSDTATADGRAMFGMLSVPGRVPARVGRGQHPRRPAAPRARGRKGGRPSKLGSDQIELAHHRVING